MSALFCLRVLFEEILLKPLISVWQRHWLPIDVDFLFRQGNGPLSFFRKLITMIPIPRQGKMEPKTNNNTTLNKVTLLFLCIPVSPGRSRVIWSFPRNFANSLAGIIPRWYQHITNNLVLDSDLYLLHLLVILVHPYYMFMMCCNFERKSSCFKWGLESSKFSIMLRWAGIYLSAFCVRCHTN